MMTSELRFRFDRCVVILGLLGACLFGCNRLVNQAPLKSPDTEEARGAKRVSAPALKQSSSRGERRALLIANNEYRREGKLETPPRDVELMREHLDKLGFRVEVHLNLGGLALRDVVADFSETLQPQDEVYFHYAGHGLELDGEAMLLGVDFSAREKREAVYQGFHVSAVVGLLSRAQRAVAVIDACRNNPYARSIAGGRSSDSPALGLPTQVSVELDLGSRGVYLVFSTTRGEVAQDGADVSPLVDAFSAVIDEHGHRPVRELFSGWVQPKLMKRGQQLATRTFGIWRAYPLRRPDERCPELCRPGCKQACIEMALQRTSETRARVEETQTKPSQTQARSDDEIPQRESEETPLSPSQRELIQTDETLPKIQWITLPAGRFEMGSTRGDTDERPVHTVQVQSFRIAETEVTVAQFRKCVEAGVCFPPNVGLGCTWTYEPKDKESHPINCVDWGQARTFSRWVGGDLPTEAQWEYAARGGGRDQYAGANQPDRVGWYEENSGGETHPVRQKSANGFGLYDMSGNVWEWTLDEKHVSYKGAPDQAERAWGDVPPCDTRCISGEEMRVVRGGSWRNNRLKLRVTDRSVINANIRHYNLGFRLVSLPVEGDH